jgi:biotin/methionine sulfoxide reductase
MIAMKKLIEPVGEALADYEIFAAVARPLGKYEDFTENRTKRQWLAFLFETTRKALAGGGHDAPAFEEFWEIGELHLPLNPTAVDRRGLPAGPVRVPASDAIREDRNLFAGDFGYLCAFAAIQTS